MGKKSKKQQSGQPRENAQAAQPGRFSHQEGNEDSYLPFAKIKDVTPTKIESPTPKAQPVQVKAQAKVVKKQKTNIISGFVPGADFGDILSQWEATGDPFAMPGKKDPKAKGVGRRIKTNTSSEDGIRKMVDTTAQAKKTAQQMDFATIFAQWEGKQAPKPKAVEAAPAKPSKVVRTGPPKDFSEILNEWEASQGAKVVAKPVVQKAPEVIPAPQVEAVEEEPEEEVAPDNGVRPVWSAGKPTGIVTERVSGGGGFADIYDAWAAQQREIEEAQLQLAAKEKEPRVSPALELSKLRQMLPEATIDLHGLTGDEASNRVRSFLQDCRANGIRKLCIIHGKGLHAPTGQGILKEIVVREIENSKLVREFGAPAAKYGGSGVLWVIMKD